MKKSRVIFSTVTGFLVSGALFISSTFSFGYSPTVAGIIVSCLVFLICTGMVLSSRCRCIMALVFPSFFSGKGRSAILSIILGFILSGSVSHNFKETGTSMACFIDLLINQTDVSQTENYLRQMSVKHRRVLETSLPKTDPVQKLVEDLESDMQELCCVNSIYMYQKCIESVRKQNCLNECKKWNESQSGETPVDDCIYSCQQWETYMCSSLNVSHDLKHLRYNNDRCSSNNGSHDLKHLRYNNDRCSSNNVSHDLKHLRSFVDKLKDVYKNFTVNSRAFQIRRQGLASPVDYGGVLNNTDILLGEKKLVNKNVKSKLNSKINTLQTVLQVFRNFLLLYQFLLFWKAYRYVNSYLSKDWHNNIYITKRFIEHNEFLIKSNGTGTLPLTRDEKKKYVFTLSLKLHQKETKHCKKGLIRVVLHLSVCTILVFLDYSLFYILNLIRELGSHAIKRRISVIVKGDGPIAAFYMDLFRMNSITDQSIAKCLPSPLFTIKDQSFVIVGLYVIAVCFVILRGYGLRLRRKIAAYFYPDQETSRIEYLHKLIQHQRVARRMFLQMHVLSVYKEKLVREKFSLSSRLVRRFPSLAKLVSKKNKVECSSCELRQGIFNHGFTYCSGMFNNDVNCPAVYCDECKLVLDGKCPLCSNAMKTK